MLTIELRQVKLHAYHGMYEGESKIGSLYELDLKVSYDEPAHAVFEEISDTVNYADLYTIVKNQMAIPTALLEAVAEKIVIHIKEKYPMVKSIEVSIYKLQPPIVNFEGRVGITLNRTFHE